MLYSPKSKDSNKKMNQRIKSLVNFWLPVVVWCGLIFYLSSRPLLPPTGNWFFDVVLPNLAHLVEYGVLFLLLLRGSKRASVSLFIAVLYALSDEFHQSFVPTRTASFWDILIDISGMLIAWLVIWKWLPIAPKKLKNWAKKLQLI